MFGNQFGRLKGSSTSTLGASASFDSSWHSFSSPTGDVVLGRLHVLPPGELAEDIHVGIPMAGRSQS